MDLMVNKYLNFDNIEFNGKIVKNTSSINRLPKLSDLNIPSSLFYELKLEDNRLLEAVSFDLYESTDYWDILMLINGMTVFNSLPLSYDTVLNKAQDRYNEWLKFIGNNRGYESYEIEQKYNEILKEENEKNEKYRYIKYVNSSDMPYFETQLKAFIDKTNIDENLIKG